MLKRTITTLAGVLALTGLLAAPAVAQDKFPSRPITLIYPFPPGGPIDVHLRVLAAQAEKVFGQPIIIDTKPGASATLGPATMAATAKPDGYTISEFSVGIFTVPQMQKTSFDPAKDFTYIIGLASGHLVTLVKADSPWKTWADLAADAKARPGQISWGSTGAGGTTHLAFEQLMLGLGLKFLHVPLRGGAEQMTALLGDHVKVIPTGGLAGQAVDGGLARPLLWLTVDPGTRYAGLPTLRDVGVEPMIDTSFPYGIGGPKGMKPEIVKILHDGFKKAADTPEHAAVLKQIESDYRYMSSEDYTKFAHAQIAAYTKFMEAIGIKKPN